MNTEKYIGFDVHQATIAVAVLDHTGKLIMECILETKAATILEFFAGLRGTLSVTFEEGTSAAWVYDLLRPHVARLVVCNPRKNALLKQGRKSDRIDAHKLAELLRGNYLKSVYHGETGVRTLRELARSYLTTTKDLTRVMSRLKALYRSWAIPCAGRDVPYTRHRDQWLDKIPHAGVHLRAAESAHGSWKFRRTGPIAPVDQLSGTGRIYLVQIDPHDPSYSLDDFAEWLHSKYALDVRVVPPIALDPSAWNIWRRQFPAEMVFEYLKREHPDLANGL